MKKFLALALALVMMLAVFAGCSNKDDKEETGGSDTATFKIGCTGPLTGEAAIYGSAVKAGAEIAVEEINENGGINGMQIEFSCMDDVSDGETAVNAYNNLMDWGMQVLVGPVTTGPALSVSENAYTDRVFTLTPSASSTDVTNGKDNVFQVCFTDPAQGTEAAEYMLENHADSKIAAIYKNDDAYSQGIFDAFKSVLADGGVELVYEGTFTTDTSTDFSVQLAAAQAAGADVLFLPMYYQPASVILAQAKAANYSPLFFGVDGMDGILTLDGFDTALAEGVKVLSPFSADETDDATVSFVEKYKEKTGETPNQFAADAYDCIYAIKAAYEAAAEAGLSMDTTEELCDALVATFTDPDFSVDGLTGSGMTWGENGQVSKSPKVYTITDGKYVLD